VKKRVVKDWYTIIGQSPYVEISHSNRTVTGALDTLIEQPIQNFYMSIFGA